MTTLKEAAEKRRLELRKEDVKLISRSVLQAIINSRGEIPPEDAAIMSISYAEALIEAIDEKYNNPSDYYTLLEYDIKKGIKLKSPEPVTTRKGKVII